MNKEQYRTYFKKWQKYLKFAQIVNDLEIPKNSFSQFMSGNNNVLTIERLEKVRERMEEIGEEIKDDRLD